MKFLIGLLINISAFFFNVALRLSRRYEPDVAAKVDAVALPEPTPDAEEDTEESDAEPAPIASAGESTAKPFFRGENGDAIPLNMDPLPEFRIFEAMFDRKYGKFGRMPITISGTPRMYNVYEIFTLLEQISKHEEPNPMMQAIYGSVMTVIMSAHGENIDPKHLN